LPEPKQQSLAETAVRRKIRDIVNPCSAFAAASAKRARVFDIQSSLDNFLGL